MKRVRVAGPWITQKEIDYVTDAVTNAWYDTSGVYHERFERAFADYVGRRFALTLPSCTSAIHLALAALGVHRSDEVIVPEITWIASAAPISYVGATPVFADIDERTWCLSADSFEKCLTERTRAVIPVDLYGNVPEMDRILRVAQQHGVAVIEDAAEAAGAEYHGRRAGSFGTAGVFSFHGSKTLTTGEGGMLVTDDENLFHRALVLRDHGRQPGDRMFVNTEVAFKYKMSALQAALGLAQLERLEELIARKRQIFGWYREELAPIHGLVLNPERPETVNTYWMVTAILPPEWGLRKEVVMEALNEHGVDSRPFFNPLSSLPAYRRAKSARGARARNPVSYRLSPWGINLPSGLNLTIDDVRYVCDCLRRIFPQGHE
jgi:perosamine synthetase